MSNEGWVWLLPPPYSCCGWCGSNGSSPNPTLTGLAALPPGNVGADQSPPTASAGQGTKKC